jgi:hypothetical protein
MQPEENHGEKREVDDQVVGCVVSRTKATAPVEAMADRYVDSAIFPEWKRSVAA